MNKVLTSKTIPKRSKALHQYNTNNQEESLIKPCANSKKTVSLLMVGQCSETKSKRGILIKTNNSIKKSGVNGVVVQPKDTTPRSEISIDFAAKQFFQILLMDIKSRHALNNNLEPVVSAFSV